MRIYMDWQEAFEEVIEAPVVEEIVEEDETNKEE